MCIDNYTYNTAGMNKLKILYRSLETTSTSFIKTHSLAEELFRADTQTDERTDKHNDANNLFSQAFVIF
jgi:hypothetical protein